MKIKSVKAMVGDATVLVASALIAAAAAAESPEARSTIHPADRVLTMVNVLTPEPGRQAEVIGLLQAGMQDTMRHQPGFISANIHRSLDSDHVVVYAQWKDQASVDAAVKLIQAGQAPNMAQVFAIATPDFHPYRVVSVHTSATVRPADEGTAGRQD